MSWRYQTEAAQDVSHWNLARCHGCGRCSAACPVAEAMDSPPSAAVRLALDGHFDRLARLSAPWICTDCRACSDACPQGIAVARFLGALRQACHLEQRFEDVPVDVEMVSGFHEAFLVTCRASGRAGHWATFLRYRLRTLDVFTNLSLGLAWLLAGRLRLLPRAPSLAMGRLFRRIAALHEKEAQDEGEAGTSAAAADVAPPDPTATGAEAGGGPREGDPAPEGAREGRSGQGAAPPREEAPAPPGEAARKDGAEGAG